MLAVCCATKEKAGPCPLPVHNSSRAHFSRLLCTVHAQPQPSTSLIPMYYCVAIPWQVVEWEEARKKCNDECRLSVSILVAMNCLSAMHRNLGRMRAANRVMDAALALHKETFLKQPGSTAGEPGGLLHALAPVFESSSSSFLRQFERSLTEDFKEDILIGLVYSPWRGMERQQVALSPKSVESERFPVLGRPGP